MANRTYTPEEKRLALKAYLETGTYLAAEERCGVPRQTIASWKCLEREWWDRVSNEIVTELEGDYRPGWVRVLGKAMEAIEDRITNGDHQLTKDGIVRVPVKGKELGIILGIAADKLKQFGLVAPSPTAKQAVQERQKRLVAIAQEDRAQQAGAVQ